MNRIVEIFGKGKRAAGAATGLVTGKAVDDKLTQYSEVYGEVLLGMHRDIERFRAFVTENDRTMQETLSRIAGYEVSVSNNVKILETTVAKTQQCEESAHRFSEDAHSSADRADDVCNTIRDEVQLLQNSHGHLSSRLNDLGGTLELQQKRTKSIRAYLTWVGAIAGFLMLSGALLWIFHFRF